MIYRALVVCVALVLLAVAGCNRQPVDRLAAHAGSDVTALDESAYVAASADIMAAIDVDFMVSPGARAYGPQLCQAVADGYVVVAWLPDEMSERLVVAHVEGTQLRWRSSIDLAAGTALKAVASVAVDGVAAPCLAVDLSGAVERLYVAVGDDGALLLRAEARGQLANSALHRAHPDAVIGGGDLASADRIERLAATVALADPAQGALRAEPGVRGQLEAFARGTDVWLAQAGAELLTQ
ncbi:MAG: hypothetical protein ACYTF0_04390 [Planctomycetota bacterium]|jgi:hypothetical protein